ncbi:hypothetical protein N799_09085 [Lysobacter arseniciresistens ZS79]|uniref:Pesticin C-terminal domain-containing protein n=1 Tax=Lysobacter arseniciresistens ZS79 TaxID=913325 RepID=A0A0A0EWW5_9GAMM|nr:pesticin C-terminus-like muramidase [Lysobacter arseniciresistens]KGM54573.1 hypothetical protein N799_09085 [Lysobacter arseniciresistens ZS79]
MPDRIDYAFIAAREGALRLDGYVPDARFSRSGVTIATGFDLGQRHRIDLLALGLPARLIDQLDPYLGVTRQDARTLLAEKPLRITMADALLINSAFKARFVARLAHDYGASVLNRDGIAFFDLPAEAQTTIASVAFQYGDLATAAPRFWRTVCLQDWRAAVTELRAFGDRYPTRRNLEADLLSRLLETPAVEAAR